jgi:hypothetical protein
MTNLRTALYGIALYGILLPLCAESAGAQPFAIQVVDDQTGRGVPLVELTTVNNIRYVTDSAGVAAVDDASLMGQRVFFHVRSHGYEFAPDGFGMQGRALELTPGGETELKIRRVNIAERLYRVTGGGIYSDSVKLGREVPLTNPLLNAGVLGSDSVVNTVFNGRIHWFWGDTNLPQYPLGNFHVPGAVSLLPEEGGLDPSVGVDLQYFVNEKGQAKETCRMPGEGPTWIDGLTVLGDEGRERLFAHYVKIRPPMETYARGIVEFDPEAQQFRHVRDLELESRLRPAGHPVRIPEDGVDYICFAAPFPYTRVRATVEDFLDPGRYEAYTCLMPGDSPDSPEIIRDAQGRAELAWRRGGIPFDYTLTQKLAEEGKLKPEELPFQLHDSETGKPIRSHGGSLAWNEYRQKWVMIVLEVMGSSLLGEIWYAEADTPLGPWHDAVKVVTHNDYSCYNPRHHPMLDQQNGRYIYFEGTYTHTFSGTKEQTPRYDYNQIMYRLDLADDRLHVAR